MPRRSLFRFVVALTAIISVSGLAATAGSIDAPRIEAELGNLLRQIAGISRNGELDT